MELLKVLETQLNARIAALIEVEHGSYRFHRDFHTGEWAEMPGRPLEQLIHTSLSKSPRRASKLFTTLLKQHGNRPVRARPEAEALLTEFRFGARTHRILRVLDGRTIEEVARSEAVRGPESALALYLLWAAGGLEAGACGPAAAIDPGD